jgi:ABC-type ATPase involved in cell division
MPLDRMRGIRMESPTKTTACKQIEIQRRDMEFLIPPHYGSRKSTLEKLLPKKEKSLPSFVRVKTTG